MDTLTAFGHAIFCDDIRFEQGGKITLVGTYPNAMIVHSEFPVTLPKFGIVVVYIERLDSRTKSPVEICISLPGEAPDAPVIRATLRPDEVQIPDLFEDSNVPPVEFLHANMPLIFSPFVLGQPGLIRVWAMREGEEISLGRLRVRKALAGPQATTRE